jgi:hypothetical protein
MVLPGQQYCVLHEKIHKKNHSASSFRGAQQAKKSRTIFFDHQQEKEREFFSASAPDTTTVVATVLPPKYNTIVLCSNCAQIFGTTIFT